MKMKKETKQMKPMKKETKIVKATPVKTTPVKTTPVKATPVKVAPAKAVPTKVVAPAKQTSTTTKGQASVPAVVATSTKKHVLPALPYAYNALEPYMDEATVRLHHDKHHQTYVDNLNLALDKHPELYKLELGALLANLNVVPEDIRLQVKNHGGGVLNHNFFWTILKKDTKPSGKLLDAINKEFGGYEKFKEAFTNSAKGLFGSGWTWLVLNKGKLEIINLPNQDNSLSVGKIPILTLDLWEHSFYILYNNRKIEYINNFFNIINWDVVEKNYEKALKGSL